MVLIPSSSCFGTIKRLADIDFIGRAAPIRYVCGLFCEVMGSEVVDERGGRG